MKKFFDFLAKRREKVKIADIREYLFQQLIENSDGFKKVRGADSIIREKEYGKDIFKILIHTRRYGYALEFEAYKRFEELETLYAEFWISKNVSKESYKYSGTIGKRLHLLLFNGPLPNGYNQLIPYYEYDIITRYDLEKVTKKIIVLLKKTEKAFFERFNTYQELYDIVNVDIRKLGKYDITYSSKALLGITLSRLLKDKNYESIKEIYLEQVEKYVPADVPKLLGLIKKLEENW